MLIIYLIEITLHVCSKLKVSGKMKVKVLFFFFLFLYVDKMWPEGGA